MTFFLFISYLAYEIRYVIFLSRSSLYDGPYLVDSCAISAFGYQRIANIILTYHKH